jgi:hypothetical protein
VKINSVTLNGIHNALKELVTEQGAFVILLAKPDLEGEDVQFRIYGPDTRLNGLLLVGHRYLEDHLQRKMDALLAPKPAEPD